MSHESGRRRFLSNLGGTGAFLVMTASVSSLAPAALIRQAMDRAN
jgi:hypothetical protein